LCAAVAASFHSVQVLKFGLSFGKSKLLLGSCSQCIIIIIHVCKKKRTLFYKLTPTNWPAKKNEMREKRKKTNEKEKISIHHPPLGCADNNNTNNSIIPKAQNVK
jgi:hypothetical protein